jgi:2-dehydro-3-deoxyphosphogluconate aldolase/(4S)-4-hydroxy-2-oxoglutarate aldolase
MSFMPSGGVSADNLTDYLAIPAVPAVSGSWMVAENLLATGSWDEVTSRSTAAVTAARQTSGSSLTTV